MNIVHITFAGAYTEGMTYQEVMLSNENLAAGHQVTVIASCYEYNKGKIVIVPPLDILLPSGKRIIRLPYKRIINRFFSEKLRKVTDLYDILDEIKPDVVFYHDIEGYELLTVSRYKRNNPNTALYVDTHSDEYNSARNLFSKIILHKMIYHSFFMRSYKFFDKIFYISEDTKNFLIKTHNFKETNMLEFYPLGGKMISVEAKKHIRNRIRDELKLSNDELLFVHSGKINELKRTLEILFNLEKLSSNKIKLVIIGTIEQDYMKKLSQYIHSQSVLFLGWKDSQDLLDYISAADLYLQPGSQSAVMQNALCVGTPVLLFNYISHKVYDKGNIFLIDDYSQMYHIFKTILNNPTLLSKMSEKAFKFSRSYLDYKLLAERIAFPMNCRSKE